MKKLLNKIIYFFQTLGRDMGELIEITVEHTPLPPPHIEVETWDGRKYCLKGDIMVESIILLESCKAIHTAPVKATIEFLH